ncbi:hypothetical protein D3C85_1661470 [compost metagenome]
MNINQMMGDSVHFGRADLGCADIHAAVHLHGVAGDDLGIVGLSQLQAQPCFADGCRAQQHEHLMFRLSCQCGSPRTIFWRSRAVAP